MEVIRTVKLRNLPQNMKLVEASLSGAYSEFLVKNPEVTLNEIHIIFMGGQPTKEVIEEVK